LKRLFNQFYSDNNIQPKHIFYPMLMMATGYTSLINYDWVLFGWVVFILGIFFAIVIIVGIAWRGPTEYWKQIEDTLKVMIKIKDPSIWVSMGYKNVPTNITIEEKRIDEHGEYQGSTFIRPDNISPVIANTLANKMLMSSNVDFTKDLYGNVSTDFRKLHNQMKQLGYIRPKNVKNVRNGYKWSKKGIDFCYQYADDEIKKLIRKERNETN